MRKEDAEKFILRYTGDGDAPEKDVTHIKEAYDVEVLDVSSRMALVCGTSTAISDLTQSLPDWRESPMREVEIPGSRPKVKERPARSANSGGKSTTSSRRNKK